MISEPLTNLFKILFRYIELTFTFALKLGMMDGFGTGEKDKEVCVVYQDDDQKVQMSYQRIYNIMNNNMNCYC